MENNFSEEPDASAAKKRLKYDSRLVDADTAEVIRQLEEDCDNSTVRIQRLIDLVEFAIAAIDSNHCYMGEEAQVDLRDYLKEMVKKILEGKV